MVEGTSGRIFKMAEEAVGASGDSVGKVYKIETTAYGWPDGRPMYHTMMEGSQ
jgi:hypothetical protein